MVKITLIRPARQAFRLPRNSSLNKRVGKRAAPGAYQDDPSRGAAPAHEPPLIRYLTTSSLMSGRRHLFMPRSGLEHWLALRAGERRAFPFRTSDFQKLVDIQQSHFPDLVALASEIRNLARVLTAAGLEILVIDSLEHLNRRQAERFIYAITHIWESGLDVALVTPDSQYLSFNEMAEVVKGTDFIRTYVNSYITELHEIKQAR